VASLEAIRPSSSSISQTVATSQGRQRAVRSHDDEDGPQRILSGGPVADIRKTLESADEMSSVMAQFRLRTMRKEENRGMAQSYDYILEEDAPNKILAILGASWVTAEGLSRLLKDAFDDVTDRWLALQALDTQRESLDSAQQQALTEAIQLAQDAPRKEIRERKAGIHCAIKARLSAKQMPLEFGPRMLRAAYREFLINDAGTPDIDIYQSWISRFGYTRREQVLNFIEATFVDDMRSLDPSSTQAEALSPTQRLNVLKRLRSCERTFVQRVSTSPFAEPFNANEEDWLHFVLAILTDPRALDECMSAVAGPAALLQDNGAHGRLIGLLYRACSDLPGEPLQTQEARDVLLDGLRDLADAAYRRERSDRASDPVSRHRRSV